MTIEAQFPDEQTAGGSFERQEDAFRDWVRADGGGEYPARAGRYHLYVSLACPWARRTVIVRKLKGLEDAIGMTVVDPIRDERGWRFTPAEPDPINGFAFSQRGLLRHRSRLSAAASPCRCCGTSSASASSTTPTTTSAHVRTRVRRVRGASAARPLSAATFAPAIDALNALLYENGQQRRLSRRLCDPSGAATNARLDACSKRSTDLKTASRRGAISSARSPSRPIGASSARSCASTPSITDTSSAICAASPTTRISTAICAISTRSTGIAETVDFDHIKRHYYYTHDDINPTRIVPIGPIMDLTAPHGREGLGAPTNA